MKGTPFEGHGHRRRRSFSRARWTAGGGGGMIQRMVQFTLRRILRAGPRVVFAVCSVLLSSCQGNVAANEPVDSGSRDGALTCTWPASLDPTDAPSFNAQPRGCFSSAISQAASVRIASATTRQDAPTTPTLAGLVGFPGALRPMALRMQRQATEAASAVRINAVQVSMPSAVRGPLGVRGPWEDPSRLLRAGRCSGATVFPVARAAGRGIFRAFGPCSTGDEEHSGRRQRGRIGRCARSCCRNIQFSRVGLRGQRHAERPNGRSERSGRERGSDGRRVE
jgi:hypothetical protein